MYPPHGYYHLMAYGPMYGFHWITVALHQITLDIPHFCNPPQWTCEDVPRILTRRSRGKPEHAPFYKNVRLVFPGGIKRM